MHPLKHALLIISLAWRHLVGHRRKNFITGLVLALNAAFVVVGTAVVSTVDARVFKMLSSTFAGDMQIYSVDAPEEMLLTAAQNGQRPPELGVIDYPKVEAMLKQSPNVAAVVPMGTYLSMCILPNAIDEAIESLRIVVREDGDVDLAIRRARNALDAKADEFSRLKDVPGVEPPSARDFEALARSRSDEFWADFKSDPVGHLHFLEDRVVPIAGDTDLIGFPLIGADIPDFRQGFAGYRLVKGRWLEPGERGVLVNRSLWNFYFELSVAREFERLNKDLLVDKKPMTKEALANRTKVLADSYDDLLGQLDAKRAAAFKKQLQAFLKTDKGTLAELVQQYLTVDADNFAERYAFYKEQIVPNFRLHRIEPGDSLLLRSFGTFPTSVSATFAGVVEVPEFKDAPVANLYHIIDLVSFRILEGETTQEQLSEFAEMREAVPFNDITFEEMDKTYKREDVSTAELAKPAAGDLDVVGGTKLSNKFDEANIGAGRVVHAAVFVKDLDMLSTTARWIEEQSVKIGVPLQVGGINQFAMVSAQLAFFRAVIIGGTVVVVLVVVLVSLLGVSIVVLGRMRELAVLRALGAAPAVAIQALMVEMSMLGLMAGLVGVGLGALIIRITSRYGIPAPTPSLRLIFAGKSLYPVATPSVFVIALIATIVVTLIATIYPARVASRVEPALALK